MGAASAKELQQDSLDRCRVMKIKMKAIAPPKLWKWTEREREKETRKVPPDLHKTRAYQRTLNYHNVSCYFVHGVGLWLMATLKLN